MSKKALFITLGVLACLYFAALGTGVVVNKSGNGKNDNPSDLADRWIGKLAGLMPSGPSALTPAEQCNGQAMKGSFRLAGRQPSCTTQIKLPSGEDRANVSITLAQIDGQPANVGAYVESLFDETQFPDIKSDKSCRPQQPPTNALIVKYEPAKGASGKYKCFIQKKAGEAAEIAILEGGGRLTLTCEKCKSTLTIEGE